MVATATKIKSTSIENHLLYNRHEKGKPDAKLNSRKPQLSQKAKPIANLRNLYATSAPLIYPQQPLLEIQTAQ
jgi:hypothetical protein